MAPDGGGWVDGVGEGEYEQVLSQTERGTELVGTAANGPEWTGDVCMGGT